MPYLGDGNAGYQRTDTSRDAAQDIQITAATVRQAVLNYLHTCVFPATTEEIAQALQIDYRTVQPRVSELRNKGRVTDSGVRKMGSRGKYVIAWHAA